MLRQDTLYQDTSILIGTGGNDVLRSQQSVTFIWSADRGPQTYAYPLDPAGNHYWYGQSWATGRMTFNGVSPSEAFYAHTLGDSFQFRFTNGTRISTHDQPFSSGVFWSQFLITPRLGDQSSYNDAALGGGQTLYAYNTATVLTVDPAYHRFVPEQTEAGHWALLDEPHPMLLLGGAGDDTIFGGQGSEALFGGAGNDTIWLGPGDDRALGDEGNDTIHGGVGDQFISGGAGNDVIYGGNGAQFITGGSGSDEIYGGNGAITVQGDAGDDQIGGGTGDQRLSGGDGADTLWGGVGDQVLMGNAGNDILHAGQGHTTFYGGAGRDTFVFEATYAFTGTGPTDIMDFQTGQDVVQISLPPNLRVIDRISDIPAHITNDAQGNAVFALGFGPSTTLFGISAEAVKAQPEVYFRLVPSTEPVINPFDTE